MNSIDNFALGEEDIDAILDKYLVLDDTIIPSSLTTKIKTAIVSEANTKVEGVKSNIIAEINKISCSNRLLEAYDVDGYGVTTRMLQTDLTFAALENAILAVNENVASAAVGLFADRKEISIDATIHVSKDLADTSDIKDALETVFAKLDDAKAMFGASSDDKADVTALLGDANSSVVVEFDLSIR